MTEKSVNNIESPFKLIDFHGICMPEIYIKFADEIENFEIRDDDIWICSFPKAGTTWILELVWCIANDLDFEGAKVPESQRVPFLEGTFFIGERRFLEKAESILPPFMLNSFDFVRNLQSPRFVKTHLPFELLPRKLRTGETKAKIVYVARNPKDTCISRYHFSKEFTKSYQGDFDAYSKRFVEGKVYYSPFWEHILGYWGRRHPDNLLFIKYEDMQIDLAAVIGKTAEFLDKKLKPEEVEKLMEHLSFESMKNNEAVNRTKVSMPVRIKSEPAGTFMRCGKMNQWKETMTEDMIAKFDSWTAEKLESTDFDPTSWTSGKS